MVNKGRTISSSNPEPEMLEEYDFSRGVRGKFAARYATATNLVIIDPDLTEDFPDSETVNTALRELLRLRERELRKLPPK